VQNIELIYEPVLCSAITQDFLAVLEKCPSKIKKKLTNHKVVYLLFKQSFSAENIVFCNLLPEVIVTLCFIQTTLIPTF
jgi:hypothetical protein